jgi:hypothetical protein
MERTLRQPGDAFNARHRPRSSGYDYIKNPHPSQFGTSGDGAHIKDQMGGAMKTNGNTIIAFNSEPLHQNFLQRLKKQTADGGDDRMLLANIVHITPDGRSELVLEDQYVEDKINCPEDAETDVFKTWQRLEATLKSLANNAEREIEVIKLEYLMEQQADAKKAAAKAVQDAGDPSPRPLHDSQALGARSQVPVGAAGAATTVTPRMPTRASGFWHG